jgi:hypothetical protein
MKQVRCDMVPLGSLAIKIKMKQCEAKNKRIN